MPKGISNLKMNLSQQQSKRFVRVSAEDYKTFYWKAFERQRFGWYVKVGIETKRLLKEEARAIGKLYINRGKTGVLDYLKDRRRTWEKTLKALYSGILTEFGARTYNQLTGKANYFGIIEKGIKDFDPYAGFINQWASDNSAYRAALISASSQNIANDIITQGVTDELGIPEIAQSLQQVYDEDSIYRSARMARTEVVGASNFGSLQGAKQTGFQNLTKTWVSSRDERVRESHQDVDGETVLIDDIFSNDLEYPGDPAGEPEEVIHCRCVLAYGFGEEFDSDTIAMEEQDHDDNLLGSVESLEYIIRDASKFGIEMSREEAERIVGAVADFSGFDYGSMREAQRIYLETGKWDIGAFASSSDVERAQLLEKYIEMHPNFPKEKVLARGIDIDKALSGIQQDLQTLKTVQIGDEITMGGASSWSDMIDRTNMFSNFGQNSIQFVLEGGSSQSASIKALSTHASENEIVVSMKSKFQVTSNPVYGTVKDANLSKDTLERLISQQDVPGIDDLRVSMGEKWWIAVKEI